MATRTKNRRRTQRIPISETTRARVEFNWPHPNGESLSLSLIDISSSGFSFALGESLPGLSIGTEVEGVTLRFEDSDVRGEMVVLHLGAELATGTNCGVLFYPESDQELVKLKKVIAGMESLQSA